jgi:spermidine/putrescine transport system substrate-binding protein
MRLTRKEFILGLTGLFTSSLLAACAPKAGALGNAQENAAEITIYGWEGYMPQTILDAFTKEYHVEVRYDIYASATEATAAIRQGNAYDVVVLDNVEVQNAVQANLLAELDRRHLPNFKQIANDFRDLAFDPNNKYSVPFEWGTTGLLYRSEMVDAAPTHWADLWNPAFTGKIGLWPDERDLVGLTLKSLGYSYNSESPDELAQAGERLMALRDRVVMLDPLRASGVPNLLDGEFQILFGWSFDMHVANEEAQKIDYIIPEEGTVIWMDNLVVPANSPHKESAELFLNFIMRPEIGAQIANEMYVAVPNQGAHADIDPQILNNPLIFPTTEDLEKAELYEPVGPEAQALYREIGRRFVDAIT